VILKRGTLIPLTTEPARLRRLAVIAVPRGKRSA
jgi:hypothetical protein